MQYWILQHNPRLLPVNIPAPPGVPLNRDYWHISRYARDVCVGDIAFIWHAGVNRGIHNVATVVSTPPHGPEADSHIRNLTRNDAPFWTEPAVRDRLRQRPTLLIEYRYPHGLHPPILVQELRQQGFSGLPVLEMPQRGIYRVEDSAGGQLLHYISVTQPRSG
ncbi:MAG: EVE domain-containing protein [Desulfobacterales bacterium]|nr:EVE domain-containing protein [Desulfobacterales bacterium]